MAELNKKEIIKKLREIKINHQAEGFIILGVFGSYARNDENVDSDIDILYELTDDFYKKYPGWDMIPILDTIEKECESQLGKKIDLANKNALNSVGKKYILPEVIYV